MIQTTCGIPRGYVIVYSFMNKAMTFIAVHGDYREAYAVRQFFALRPGKGNFLLHPRQWILMQPHWLDTASVSPLVAKILHQSMGNREGGMTRHKASNGRY